MSRWVRWAAIGCTVMAGCVTAGRGPEISPPPAERLAARYVGAPLGRWVQVRKRERQLILLEDTQPIRTYAVVLGGEPDGAKLHEGDNRTPEGEYRIAAKYPHPAWSRFLLLDYPTPANRDLYQWTRQVGLLPGNRHGLPGIGGQVGIHGTSDERLNQRGENWTRGCISLLNHDVEELYAMIDVGTRVVIEK